MNTDIFLTRVFDKQEQKMIYQGDTIDLSDFGWGDCLKFMCASNKFVYADPNAEQQCIFVPLGDRYIPMLCSGERDKNKKLIYTGDFIAGHYDEPNINRLGVKIINGLIRFEKGCMRVYEVDYSDQYEPDEFACYLDDAEDIEIIGNSCDNPELWKKKAK